MTRGNVHVGVAGARPWPGGKPAAGIGIRPRPRDRPRRRPQTASRTLRWERPALSEAPPPSYKCGKEARSFAKPLKPAINPSRDAGGKVLSNTESEWTLCNNTKPYSAAALCPAGQPKAQESCFTLVSETREELRFNVTVLIITYLIIRLFSTDARFPC